MSANIPQAQSDSEWRDLSESFLESAKVLAMNDPPRLLEAVYLAGFAIELALKGRAKKEGYGNWPGNSQAIKTHDLKELAFRSQIIRSLKTIELPEPVTQKMSMMGARATYEDLFLYLENNWKNEMRYHVHGATPPFSADYVELAEEFIRWIWTL